MDAPRRPSSSRSSIRKTRSLHPCPQCGKTFTKRSNMLIHARLHTGETPYVCKFAGCGRSYKWLSSINFHEGRCDRRNMGLAVPAPRPPPPPAAAEAARIAQEQHRQALQNAQQNLPPPLPGYASLHMTATGRSPTPPPHPPPPAPPLRPPPPQFPVQHPQHHTHHYPAPPAPSHQQTQPQPQPQPQHQPQQAPHHPQQHPQHIPPFPAQQPQHFAPAGPSVAAPSYASSLAPDTSVASTTFVPSETSAAAAGGYAPSYAQYSQTPAAGSYDASLPPAPSPPAQQLSAQQTPPASHPDPAGFHTPPAKGSKRFRPEPAPAPFSPLTPSPACPSVAVMAGGPGLSLALAGPAALPVVQYHKTLGKTKRGSTGTTTSTTGATEVDESARKFLGMAVAAVKRGRESRRAGSPVGRGGTELPGSPESACSKEVRDMLAPYAPVMVLSGSGVVGEESGGQRSRSDLENIGESFGLSDEDLFMANCSLVSVLDDLGSEEYAMNGLDACTPESGETGIGLFQ